MKKIIASAIFIAFIGVSLAQQPIKYNSSEIELMLQKLNTLGSALYVAAHPDDENTRVISYLANHKKYHTGYLSATRGDGGQNLIGPEMREALGIIRTQELLAARRVDGGKQYFARANDFGYSKTAKETFEIWDRDKVLEDFVRVFRQHKPDVIITRFPPNKGAGHGHHAASAILAEEAFHLAADPEIYPKSAEKYGAWQAQRILFNTSKYFYRRTEQVMDTSAMIVLDVGKYNTLLGQSYPEIAARSRSMHKSQGFGTTGVRGELLEYFELRDGDSVQNDMFEGINDSWNRLKGCEHVATQVSAAIDDFDAKQPHLIVPNLLKAYKALQKIENQYWKEIKIEEIKELIMACSGLYLEANANDYIYTLEDEIEVSLELINRSPLDISLKSVFIRNQEGIEIKRALSNNEKNEFDFSIPSTKNDVYNDPFWLKSKGSLGMYLVPQTYMDKAVNAPAKSLRCRLTIEKTELIYDVPIVFKKNDPVEGEVKQPIEIVPPISIKLDESVYVFSEGGSKTIEVSLQSSRDSLAGELTLELPKGWKGSDVSVPFFIDQKGKEQSYVFTIEPPKKQNEGVVRAVASINGKTYHHQIQRIDYDHIPNQFWLPKASSKLVNINLKRRGEKIAYIMGAGDKMPASLRQIGYQVDEIVATELNKEKLSNYDALILGVRAFNTVNELKFKRDEMMNYVHEGGTMIVQFNTSHRLVTQNLGPHPFKLSRDRVAVEQAEVSFLNPDHQLLNEPNKIRSEDFDNWVQERGLYFPNEWDESYEPIISCHDPDEPDREGGILVTHYGKGYYIYTGYSWFRQLPAGVPGAFRFFTNMISIGKQE